MDIKKILPTATYDVAKVKERTDRDLKAKEIARKVLVDAKRSASTISSSKKK